MLPFGVTMPASLPQGSEIPEGLMSCSVLYLLLNVLKATSFQNALLLKWFYTRAHTHTHILAHARGIIFKLCSDFMECNDLSHCVRHVHVYVVARNYYNPYRVTDVPFFL
jgi:hypothetical protein